MLQLPAGDLERLEPVGMGGFGVVYRGWSRTLKMDIAFKTIQGAKGSSIRQLAKDLMKEGDVMHKANYTYILRILGMYEKKEGILIESGLVMEYMPHGSLRTFFDTVQDVPWALRFQILHQVALGMNYLHSISPPIIHRDLKPGNVLLDKHLDVRITDFGLSKIVGVTTTAAQPRIAGTLSYMCPEALTDLNYKPTTAYDVYSFGILIWTVFSGEEPYPAQWLIHVKVPEGHRPSLKVVDQWITVKMVSEAKDLMIKCWAGRPDDRPSFDDCSETTLLMFEEYKDEIDNSIRTVQDRLKELSSSDKMMETSEELSSSMSFHANDFFGPKEGTLEPQQPTSGVEELNVGKEKKKKISEKRREEKEKVRENGNTIQEKKVQGKKSPPAEGTLEPQQPTSGVEELTIQEKKVQGKKSPPAEAVLDTVALAIKGSGEYNTVLNNLLAKGIISSENRESLDSSPIVRQLGKQAEKLVRQTYDEHIKRDFQPIQKFIKGLRW
ncbi:receptor-interacting serine/threonine-protein kinase 3-like [Discoglossus pictus]